MKSTNTKGFTLVELIIVITILAVLATIAFISFQGYSQEAKDSGKMSEMSEIVKSIAIKEAREGFDVETSLANASGALNKAAVGINSENNYAAKVTASGTYLIAGKMNKYAPGEQAGVYKISDNNYFVIGTEVISSTGSVRNQSLEDFFSGALLQAD